MRRLVRYAKLWNFAELTYIDWPLHCEAILHSILQPRANAVFNFLSDFYNVLAWEFNFVRTMKWFWICRLEKKVCF